MARFIDLDDVIPEALVVRVAGEEWQLPGDIPVPTFLEMQRLWDQAGGEDADEAVEAASRMREMMLDLFHIHHPEMRELPVGAMGLMHLVFRYLNAELVAQEDDTPARPRQGGTTKKTSSSRRKTTSAKRATTGSGSST